ncbi:MAG: flagellar brake protein, partial [Lachnospiraceae bacterium]|nr:flagellar brake protein [Lachnospiraceae bacterium]
MASKGILRKFINEGFKADIVLMGPEGQSGKDYKTQVYEIVSDEEVVFYMPTEKERLVLLPVGKRCD